MTKNKKTSYFYLKPEFKRNRRIITARVYSSKQCSTRSWLPENLQPDKTKHKPNCLVLSDQNAMVLKSDRPLSLSPTGGGVEQLAFSFCSRAHSGWAGTARHLLHSAPVHNLSYIVQRPAQHCCWREQPLSEIRDFFAETKSMGFFLLGTNPVGGGAPRDFSRKSMIMC